MAGDGQRAGRELVVALAVTLYETVPLPVPLLPPVTVIQLVLLLTAVQAQPLVVVTVAVCGPTGGHHILRGRRERVIARAGLRDIECLAGDGQRPGRELVDVLAVTLYETVPLPVPLLPPVTVIQLVLLLAAVQAAATGRRHRRGMRPTGGHHVLRGWRERVIARAGLRDVNVWPAMVSVPGRELVDVLAVTL